LNINIASVTAYMIASVYAKGVRQTAIKALFVIDKGSLSECLQANRFFCV